MENRKWFNCAGAMALSTAVALLVLGFTASNAVADGDKSDGVKVVQQFTSFNPTSSPGDCDPTTLRPVAPNPTCVASFVITGTSGPPGDMTTLAPYLNELVIMNRADGSSQYTDFTDYNVSIRGHGSGTFTMLETQAFIQSDGITTTSLNCVVDGSGTGDFVGMTGCGRYTVTPSNPLGTVVWKLHFPAEPSHQ